MFKPGSNDSTLQRKRSRDLPPMYRGWAVLFVFLQRDMLKNMRSGKWNVISLSLIGDWPSSGV